MNRLTTDIMTTEPPVGGGCRLPRSFHGAKIMMYSHDTFGLGHLRRCREIAHALVEAFSGVSVLIISGATIAGAFDYRSRVDFVKVPSVIKLRNGEYTSLAEHIPLEDTLNMRRSIIRHTAETFNPDIFIADKEPVGLRGEIEETLQVLQRLGTHMVLGLREVLDAPHLLSKEWAARGSMDKIAQYYDAVWVYGPEGFHDPLEGLEVLPEVERKMHYTGYLRRNARELSPTRIDGGAENYILVTTGGGGDGEELIRQVLAAYAADPDLTQTAVIVLGPYMQARAREELLAQGAALPAVQMIEFDNRLEDLIAGASAVVGMGGYNTFCEILSFDKPSLIVPRTLPREEQLIRAERARELGLSAMLLPEEADDPVRLARILRVLPKMPPPSASNSEVLQLDGLAQIAADVGEWLEQRKVFSGVAEVG